MNNTGINWCDKTWNPMTGCLHGCTYCYARVLAEGRLKASGAYPQGFKPVFHPDRLNDPVGKRGAVIFVGSMTDMMGAWWNEKDIQAVIDICNTEKQHTFLWLTKNPMRYHVFDWPDNCWLGVTMEDMSYANRLKDLLAVPDVKRFISIEPCLGPINFTEWTTTGYYCDNPHHGALCPEGIIEGDDEIILCRYCENPVDIGYGIPINQVIIGPENGPKARPMKVLWAISIKEQCKARGVPFFHKEKNEGTLAWMK